MTILRKRVVLFIALPLASLAAVLFAASWYLAGLIGCRGFKPPEAASPPDVEIVSQESNLIKLRIVGAADECGAVRDVA